MKRFHLFLLKNVAYSFLPFLFLLAVLWGIFLFIPNEGSFSWRHVPFIILVFPVLEISSLISSLRKFKEMGIDIEDPINQQTTITKKMKIYLSKDDIIETLNKHSWKFKIAQIEEDDKSILLDMKYYRLTLFEKMPCIQIFQTEKGYSEVWITAGRNKLPFKFMSVLGMWPFSIKHILYFSNILEKKETFILSRVALSA